MPEKTSKEQMVLASFDKKAEGLSDHERRKLYEKLGPEEKGFLRNRLKRRLAEAGFRRKKLPKNTAFVFVYPNLRAKGTSRAKALVSSEKKASDNVES
nr:hypothetical protein 8 [Desulfobacterales bacterium]